LKSTRTRARLPLQSMSRIVFFAIVLLLLVNTTLRDALIVA
jgi:hypothetical protein